MANVIIYSLIGASYAIKKEDYVLAQMYLERFAVKTNILWPIQIVKAYQEIKQAKIQSALKRLKKLSKDHLVPEEVSETLIYDISEIEKETGNVESLFFWSKIMKNIIFKELKNTSDAGAKKIADIVYNVYNSMDILK